MGLAIPREGLRPSDGRFGAQAPSLDIKDSPRWDYLIYKGSDSTQIKVLGFISSPKARFPSF